MRRERRRLETTSQQPGLAHTGTRAKRLESLTHGAELFCSLEPPAMRSRHLSKLVEFSLKIYEEEDNKMNLIVKPWPQTLSLKTKTKWPMPIYIIKGVPKPYFRLELID